MINIEGLGISGRAIVQVEHQASGEVALFRTVAHDYRKHLAPEFR
jgi:hypothetical protein